MPISHHRQPLGDPSSRHRSFSLSNTLETRGCCQRSSSTALLRKQFYLPFSSPKFSTLHLLICVTDFQFRTSNASNLTGAAWSYACILAARKAGKASLQFLLGKNLQTEKEVERCRAVKKKNKVPFYQH